MNITNRLFAYPVLSNEKNDYKTSTFDVDYKQTTQGVNSLQLTFNITMNCPELEEMILKGAAEYIIHLECTTTAYREVLHSISKNIEHVIPIGRVNGTLEAVAFVILKKHISHLVCKDWVEDFDGTSFDLLQGSILAYQNLDSLNITKDYEEFTNANSIFTVYKIFDIEDKPALIELTGHKIKIGLSRHDYEVYEKYSTKPELQSIFHSMIVLPALVYVFEELKQVDEQGSGIEKNQNREWFMALEKSYKKRGIDFINEVTSDKSSYQLAQEAMELPISKAMNEIPAFYNNTEEDS